jgi:hypothetical protein
MIVAPSARLAFETVVVGKDLGRSGLLEKDFVG